MVLYISTLMYWSHYTFLYITVNVLWCLKLYRFCDGYSVRWCMLWWMWFVWFYLIYFQNMIMLLFNESWSSTPVNWSIICVARKWNKHSPVSELKCDSYHQLPLFINKNKISLLIITIEILIEIIKFMSIIFINFE